MKHSNIKALLLVIGTIFSAGSFAERITVSVAQPNTNVEAPAKGLSMGKVLSQYGEPESKVNPVGEPPITRWVYRDFTVVFEHNFVIHSVTKRGKQE